MALRVSPTEAIRAQINELFSSEADLLSVLEQVARLSVRLTFQSVVEEVVCDELGRDLAAWLGSVFAIVSTQDWYSTATTPEPSPGASTDIRSTRCFPVVPVSLTNAPISFKSPADSPASL